MKCAVKDYDATRRTAERRIEIEAVVVSLLRGSFQEEISKVAPLILLRSSASDGHPQCLYYLLLLCIIYLLSVSFIHPSG
jgi:hypothetical protein